MVEGEEEKVEAGEETSDEVGKPPEGGTGQAPAEEETGQEA